MGDPFKHVQAGQALEIPAPAYNAMVDAARAHRHQQQIGGQAKPVGRQGDLILVRNDTGGAMTRLAVLGIDGPVIDPGDNADEFLNRVVVSGVEPIQGEHEGRFVILAEPLANGAIGRGYVSGLCPALIYVEDAASEGYRFATIEEAETASLLAATSGSAEIVWKAAGTGTVLGIVRLGGVGAGGQIYWAKATANWHNAAGNGCYVDCNPCADAAGTSPDTGTTLRVYLPRCGASDPNVEADQVIGYTSGADGSYVAATGYLDAAIGTIRMWSLNTGDPPAGWSECDSGGAGNVTGLAGRFPRGKDSGLAVGDTGGTTQHCHAMYREVASPPCPDVQIDEAPYNTIHLSAGQTSHLPPWCVVRFIERYDNSA